MSKEKLMQQLKGLEGINFNKTSLKEGLQLIADRAKEIVPVRTGHLRDSIHVEITDKSGFVTADAEYAAKVEYENHPFIRPSFDEKTDEALQLIAKAADKAIKEEVEK